jgi:hypothetical protein
MEIMVGADPEIFLRKKDGPGKPACGIIPGNKEAPHRVNCGAVQVDGLALEFNVDPSVEEDAFVHNVTTVMDILRAMVPEEYVFSPKSFEMFIREDLEGLSEDDLRLGCDPDFNAYTGDENYAHKLPPEYRFAGGHIHLGWTQDEDPFDAGHFESCCRMAKQFDYFIGLPSVLLDKSGSERVSYYGRAGTFRPKHYGMEYRTTSNWWIGKEKHIRFIFNQAVRAFTSLVHDKIEYIEHFGQQAARIINDNHKKYAKEMLKNSPEILGDKYNINKGVLNAK